MKKTTVHEINLGDEVYYYPHEFDCHYGKLRGFRFSPYDGDLFSCLLTLNTKDGIKLIETVPENIDRIDYL